MSVLIKGIAMPRKCIRCPVNVYGRCLVNDDKDVSKATADAVRDKDCPLIPVPEHGRLGDLDALHKLFLEKAKEYKVVDGTMVAMGALCIANAPTIIPAETTEEEI